MKVLSRDDILNAEDLPLEEVEVPEWGGIVYVRTMRGAERDAFEAEIVEGKGKKTTVNYQNLRAKLVQKTTTDANGGLLFTPEDVKALGQKSSRALDRVFSVAQSLNGMSEKDVEELTKN